ncbi:Ubiquitin fusion degradation protein UFD1 [Cordyceps fumosorosea ARSEF 2679]|uniref:Ubiquitin fusion degradation protein UFD1 n=1 Tax=Cordyceps fumosorosea (strain ARSEF 2679) TaxID=1081104 RepID=A0A167LDU6_CORFA|nr:Ubiquitin fusion degradation protein UFD1 [Cordyceps fumosorosea ARSEF 2679]OAA52969.1 Ubiquitin fusion degradation protein UFD1 [Cordyceps fumosorosea ARSEF 2679]
MLSPYLLKALEMASDQDCIAKNSASFDSQTQIDIHVATLQKGTYARLRPLEAGYNPDDWRPLLERQLRRNFTSLTTNATIRVQGVRGEVFQLLVDKLLPEAEGVCVVDTDLEVDIEALDEEQARETLRQVIKSDRGANGHGGTNGGAIDIWKPVSDQVSTGCYADFTLPSWDRSQPLRLTVSNMSDPEALEMFVTPKSNYHRGLPRTAEHVFSSLESSGPDTTKTIVISPTNVEMEKAESLQISIYAYPDPAATKGNAIQFTLRAQISTETNGGIVSDNVENSKAQDDNDAQCLNCRQWVPKQSLVLHESFCRRNNSVCPKCKSVFKKGSEEAAAHWHCEHDEAHGNTPYSKLKHDEMFHGSWLCPGCTFQTNSLSDLARHRTTVCPGKIILCQFCHLEVPQEGDPFNPSPEVMLSGMTAHELADGARTTECHLCDKIIKLKDMQTHLKHHELDKAGKERPPICRNQNCGRTLFGVGSRGQVQHIPGADGQQGAQVGLCSLCFGPLYVSMHDPDGKALRRRIERRYLTQLMTGCRRSHCLNEWCKTGRANAGLEPLGSSAKDALPLVKPLVATCLDLDAPVFFCVDELSQSGRRLASMIAAEGVWDVEWCIAAAEAERSNADRMREWLQGWAPRRVEGTDVGV